MMIMYYAATTILKYSLVGRWHKRGLPIESHSRERLAFP